MQVVVDLFVVAVLALATAVLSHFGMQIGPAKADREITRDVERTPSARPAVLADGSDCPERVLRTV